MPNRSPDILGLLTNRIDHMETNLSQQIHDVRKDLGERITELSARVQVQNGRVSSLEKCMTKVETEIETELARPKLDKRRIAVVGTGGVIGGAALIELFKWIGDGLHRAGILG